MTGIGEGVPGRELEIPELYWDDLVEGHGSKSPARTVTEAEVVAFAGLSGDYNAIHVDVVHAAERGLGGQRLAHGLLGLSIMSGLFTRSAMGAGMQRQLVAMLSIEWRFTAPLRIGDTVHVVAEVIGRRPTSRAERGIVKIRRELVNQDGDTVQTGTTTMMVSRRPTAP